MARPWMMTAAAALTLGSLMAAGCGRSAVSPPGTGTGGPPSDGASAPTAPVGAPGGAQVRRGTGPVDVLYAGSLVDLMERQIGPRFGSQTGYTFLGFPGGSSALAAQIKGKVRRADVFVSASPTVDDGLEGAANGGWVSWYATFADSPLVLGYNPQSRFASDLKTKPWYRVIVEPGFLLGRTDPATDPKGKLAVSALRTAARQHQEPALDTRADAASGVYPEETLLGRLQAGQLDAGFFYTSEATAAGIPTVPLTGLDLAASYTVTILRQAPDPAGAEAFVAYLLGPAGQAVLRQGGFDVARPLKISGQGEPPAVAQLAGPGQGA